MFSLELGEGIGQAFVDIIDPLKTTHSHMLVQLVVNTNDLLAIVVRIEESHPQQDV